MTSLERRGKWVLLILTGLLVVEKLAGIGFALSEGLSNIRWFKSVVTPLGMICGIIALWQGDEWLRRLLGSGLVFMGGSQMYMAVHIVNEIRQKMGAEHDILEIMEFAIWVIAIFGAFYAWIGLVLLLSPSIRAFLRFQREGPRWDDLSE